MANMSQSELVERVQTILALLKPVVESTLTITDWQPADGGMWNILLRCVLYRQFENMKTIVGLVENEKSHCCTPLLRSQCEEFLWVKFMRTLTLEDRSLIISIKAILDTYDSVAAQRRYIGDEEMRQVGFSDAFIAESAQRKEWAKKRLKKLKTRLAWNYKGLFPSTKSIANTVNETEVYDLIFHATSRTVHFNVSELLRFGWGNKRDLKISAKAMSGYWSRFALFWGTNMLGRTSAEIFEEFEDREWDMTVEVSPEEFQQAFAAIFSQTYVPIITAQELNLHIDPSKRPKFS
jgi:hypothetical protein